MHTSHCFGTTAFCSKLQMQPMHMLSQSALQKPLPGRQRQRAGARLYSDSGSWLLHVDCGGSLALLVFMGYTGSTPRQFAHLCHRRLLPKGSISQNRYDQTKRYFHIFDPTVQYHRKDWWKEVEPLSSHLRSRSQQYFQSQSNVALDEMVPKFKGRSAHTVRIPSKPILEGYKILDLCGTATCRTPRFLLLHATQRSKNEHPCCNATTGVTRL